MATHKRLSDIIAEEVLLLRDLGSRRRLASWHAMVKRSQKGAQEKITPLRDTERAPPSGERPLADSLKTPGIGIDRMAPRI
jgi:hypothetical protein